VKITIENSAPKEVKIEKRILKKLNSLLLLNLDYLNIILLTDEKLLEINQKYLNHNYYTDIITFDLRDEWSNEASLYLSVERIKDNAQKVKVSFEQELMRILIHGLLHLAGYKDKTKKEKIEIKKQEDHYLGLLFHVKNK
jgi:probable rRNA maturation factor